MGSITSMYRSSTDTDEPLLIRLCVNLYASKDIISILTENLANDRFAMRSLIYINQYIEMST